MIDPFSLTELGVFVGSCFASLGGLIFAFSKSRCRTIRCCCVTCERDVPPIIPAQELELVPPPPAL